MESYDVVIVGGGHNGLVAAAYLAREGLSVLVLERNGAVGGAAISKEVFKGTGALLSQYAYLVSLFPRQIMQELGLTFELRRRKTASFTPYITAGQHRGLLLSNEDSIASLDSIRDLTGDYGEANSYLQFLEMQRVFAERLWPTMLEPLRTRDAVRKMFDDPDGRQAWASFVEQPLGYAIERYLKNDILRGVVFTDAKVGALVWPYSPTHLQNRVFLYHVIGNATGEWLVPVGGTGEVTAQLKRAAQKANAEIRTHCNVQQIIPQSTCFLVQGFDRYGGRLLDIRTRFVLSGIAPAVLSQMLPYPISYNVQEQEGSVLKINMLLARLPKLLSGYNPHTAFAGTVHIDEGYEAMMRGTNESLNGRLPENPAGEFYCHTLTDPSILAPARAREGYQSLTFFGMDMPYRLFATDNKAVRDAALKRYLAAINKYLCEPIENCLARDVHGKPCIEAHSPLDIERELNMPKGNIFHGALSWPFVERERFVGTWGVEIPEYENIFICGAGARRGGGVSGIPGRAAAMAVLEKLRNKKG